mgnify:FL=1
MEKYDFSGWATKNDLKCTDGRVIRRDAFKDDDGKRVPLVWNHQHNDPFNVLGHADLKNREDGVYAYCKFNEDTQQGRNAKLLVEHGDVNALSICANQLKERGSDVLHGIIREVSLVLAGANPGATIVNVMEHSDESGETAIICTNEKLVLEHADNGSSDITKEDEPVAEEKTEKTVAELMQSGMAKLDQDEKDAFYAVIGAALEQGSSEMEQSDDLDENSTTDEEEDTVRHNTFDAATDSKKTDDALMHAEILNESLKDGKRYGSLKESIKDPALQHGIDDIELLFPDPKAQGQQPVMVTRDMDWVDTVMNGVHHVPFARIKSIYADLTEDEARAKGYIKGKYKKEQVFGLLKRTTQPTTVYKKQKFDRDDLIDAEFDIIPMIRREMRMMLNEELARAFLFGDGRPSSSDDKINEQSIRPVWTDEEFFTINQVFQKEASDDSSKIARKFIEACIRARKNYKGSGQPVMFTTEDILTDMLLMTDSTGRDLYTDEAQLARKLRVSRIVTVPVMEGLTRQVTGQNRHLYALILNLNDYNVGADRGGQGNTFDDFDIDYNAQKYLIETRCSGSLMKPYSAIAVEMQDPS